MGPAMEEWEHRAVTLASISLAELNAVAEMLARTDRKYVIDPPLMTRLLDDHREQLAVLDIDRDREFTYESVYFDTRRLDLYRAAATGRRHRFKVRTRLYVETGIVMLEVKTKDGRGRTVKHRTARDPAGRDCLSGDDRRFVDAVVGAPGFASALLPTLTTRYRRSTLVDSSAGSRATVDQGLECVAPSRPAVTLDRLIVETKSGNTPSPLDRWLWRQGVRPEPISKYSTALAVMNPGMPGNRWRRTIARHFADRGGSHGTDCTSSD